MALHSNPLFSLWLIISLFQLWIFHSASRCKARKLFRAMKAFYLMCPLRWDLENLFKFVWKFNDRRWFPYATCTGLPALSTGEPARENRNCNQARFSTRRSRSCGLRTWTIIIYSDINWINGLKQRKQIVNYSDFGRSLSVCISKWKHSSEVSTGAIRKLQAHVRSLEHSLCIVLRWL